MLILILKPLTFLFLLQVVRLSADDPDLPQGAPDAGRSPVLYSIVENVFIYRGAAKKASQFFELDPISGRVRLVKPLHNLAQGVFELLVTATDVSSPVRHSSRARLVFWVCEPEDLATFLVHTGPTHLTDERVEAILE